MPISQAIRNRIQTIGERNTPDDLARSLYLQGVTGIPNSDTDGIVQRYLLSQNLATAGQIARGIKYLANDGDTFLLPRSIAILIIMFNNYRYPKLLDPGVVDPNEARI